MGRIKSLSIKRASTKLLEKNPDTFTSDFEKNKELVRKFTDTDKKTKNSIAGYITRKVKSQKKK